MSILHDVLHLTLMNTHLLGYLLMISMHITSISATNAALCFVTVHPAPEMLQFAEELALGGQQYGVEVFIIIDDDKYQNPSPSITSHVQILQILNETCAAYGYQDTINLKTRPLAITSWDKAFLYFCALNTKHSFLWIIEDDVFIPSVQAFYSIHQLYSSTSDLVVQRVMPNLSGDLAEWLHWNVAIGRLFPPWYRSMANALGLSRRLLTTIADFVRWRGFNAFHEFSVQTLSINLNMTVVSPIEFDTLAWMRNYTWEDINDRPNNWWHPVKNWTTQRTWHQKIANESVSKTNNSNIGWPQLTTSCGNDSNNSVPLDNWIAKIVLDFNRIKIQLSPDERRSFRQHFLQLAEECAKLKSFTSADIMTKKLADNAYKLPDAPRYQTVRKSSTYLMIEKALVLNKQHVSQFSKNSSIVNRLREEATNLTLELTREIQKEMEQQHNQTYERDADMKNLTYYL